MITTFETAFDPAIGDLLSFFGVAATYTPLSGTPISLTVFFDQEAVREVDGYDALTVKRQKVIECRKADLDGSDYQGSFTISGTAYKVTECREDDGILLEFVVR